MGRLVLNRNGGSADEYGHLLALNRLLTGDVIEGMAVQAQSSPTMNVNVAPGSGRISTGSGATRGGYFIAVDTTTGSPAGEVVTITTANASNPRIDTIVAYVDLGVTPSSGTPNNPNNMFKLIAVAGTAAATPAAPTTGQIQSAIGAANPYIILANIAVGTSVTQINSGNITDYRTFVTLSGTTLNSGSTAWVPTVTGYGTVATSSYRYFKFGRLVKCFVVITGNPNTTSMSLTLPVNASMSSLFYEGQGGLANDNGTTVVPRWSIAPSTNNNVINVYTSVLGAGWQSSGYREIRLSFEYESTT